MRRLLHPSMLARMANIPNSTLSSSGSASPATSGLAASSSAALTNSMMRRFMFTKAQTLRIQYQQTCETNRAVESGDKKTAMKWMTKSSREFLTENDKLRAANNPERERSKQTVAMEKRESAAHAVRNEREFKKEIDMLYDNKQRRFRKSFDFFKRQGLAFFVCYVAAYSLCFSAFYYILSNNIVSKQTIFEMLFVMSNGGFDREEFVKRLEAWDTYINFGFAFILNEMLEVARFPFVMALFLTFRGTLTRLGRTMKTSIYRRSAPEI